MVHAMTDDVFHDLKHLMIFKDQKRLHNIIKMCIYCIFVIINCIYISLIPLILGIWFNHPIGNFEVSKGHIWFIFRLASSFSKTMAKHVHYFVMKLLKEVPDELPKEGLFCSK